MYCLSMIMLCELGGSRDFDAFTSQSLVFATGPGTPSGSKHIFLKINESLYYLDRAYCLIQSKQSKLFVEKK